MIPRRHRTHRLAAAVIVLAALAACARAGGPPPAHDPLAAEVARWSAFLDADTASDGPSVQVRRAVAPAVAQARASLLAGRRLHALLRIGAARGYLAPLAFTREHAAAAKSEDAFEAEWKAAGPELLDGARDAQAAVAALRPAAVRAIAEAELPDVRISYDASLSYARATDAGAGLFYLGEAEAHREMVELCRSLREPAEGREPACRDIGPEIDALQARMLAVYRPPVSIDRHGEFIGASAALKEARALNEAGAARGALLRYLQAALRFQPLRGQPPAFDAAATPAGLDSFARRLGEAGVDHSIGRLFLEAAQADLADTAAAATHAVAAGVAADVLPLYFAALAPAKPATPGPAPSVTVTLVRWPYT